MLEHLRSRYPALLALLAQLLALAGVAALLLALARLGGWRPTLAQAALAQGMLAAALGHWLGLRRWWLLLIFIVLGIGAMVVSGTVSSITMPFMFTPGTTPDAASMATTMMPYMLVNAAVDGVVRVLGTVLVAAIYVCLRESRERLTPETTAEVFN